MKIIISGGGTGGHLFPALAIADAMKLKYPYAEIIFVGAKRKMEMKIVPKHGYKIIGLNISGFHRTQFTRNIFFLFKLIFSLFHSIVILIKYKPNIVIGTGGFASGPILFCSALFRIPTLIQEQNSFPGVTNRILSRFVKKICVAYPNMEKYFKSNKIILTGNPIRKKIKDFKSKKKEAENYFNLSKNNTVLVIGGSLGAKTINESILNFINHNTFDFEIIWQTGELYYKNISTNSKVKNNNNIHVFPFISEMDLAFAAADIIVSRSGAIAISELMYVGKPIILIPSPNVAENHQYKNAEILSSNNAAILIKDKNSVQKLQNELLSLIKNQDKMNLLGNNISKMFKHNATDNIINEASKILNSC